MQQLLASEFAHTAALSVHTSVSLQLHPRCGLRPSGALSDSSPARLREVAASVCGKLCLFPHTKGFWTLTHQPSNGLVALLVEDENIGREIV